MVKRDVVAARLDKLREYLQTLKAVQKTPLAKFKADPFIHGAAERYLHRQILAERQVIPEKLFQELDGMAGFRNVLVHDYLKLDLAKVYQVINEKLKHFEALATIYAELL